MLEIKNVYKTFNPGTINEKKALNGLNLTLNDGDFVTVIGGNGAGKSTMLNMIAGVYPVDSGAIIIDGTDVTKLPSTSAQSIWGAFSRTYDGHCGRYVDRGKYGACRPQSKARA